MLDVTYNYRPILTFISAISLNKIYIKFVTTQSQSLNYFHDLPFFHEQFYDPIPIGLYRGPIISST